MEGLELQPARFAEAQLVKKFQQPATIADSVAIVVALSSVPDQGDGMAIWVPRTTNAKSGYFNKQQAFPEVTVTDPGAGFMFTENLQTERENFTSSAYSSQVGGFGPITIGQSNIMDLLIGKITFAFSADTLNVTSNIDVTVSQEVVLPSGITIAVVALNSYWRGKTVTADGQVPELDFYPWLPTFDATGFGATGSLNQLQNYIFRPMLVPCKSFINAAGAVVDNGLYLNQTKEANITLVTSNADLRTDIRLATGSSNDMVALQKELLAFKANSVVNSLPKNG